MARGPAITDDERARVRELVPLHGIRGTADILHRSPPLISDVARREGLDTNAYAAKRGAEALHLLIRERRLGLLAMLADHAEAQLMGEPAIVAAKDLRDLAVVVGVAIDKQRLEEGLSSFNAETHIRSWTVKQPPTL